MKVPTLCDRCRREFDCDEDRLDDIEIICDDCEKDMAEE